MNIQENQQSNPPRRSGIASFLLGLLGIFRMKSESDQMNEYLNASTDIYDLEARMRSWDNKKRGNGNYPF